MSPPHPKPRPRWLPRPAPRYQHLYKVTTRALAAISTVLGAYVALQLVAAGGWAVTIAAVVVIVVLCAISKRRVYRGPEALTRVFEGAA